MWFGNGDNNTAQSGETLPKQQQQDEEPKKSEDISSILGSDFDPSKLHPLAGLDKEIEYLDLDDEKLNTIQGSSNGILPSRGWGDDMCYGTGAVYVLGLGFGGLQGLNEGFKHLPQPKLDPVTNSLRPVPFKLKLNTVLNQVTKFGPHAGNTAGVMAIMYNIIDSSLDNIRGQHDDWNSLASGWISGALYKSTSGLKAIGISSTVMTIAAASWCGFKRLVAGNNGSSFGA
ncbi:DEKNAAC101995 [Brettanomyces naardenensis]|uniref:DEKNAAC101995 n=1 Tax=Brettanomyces naardenensis TaxID=13370 RepID=A0A448YJ78_BRENA|nr:DEKNAAC101995 [Brettanomyces naardenensis]